MTAALAPLGARAGAPALAVGVPDVAVIGAGAFGVWTAHALRAAGARVTLLDAYGAGSSRATSGGESRITRSAYGAQEIYARWAADSLSDWKHLQERRRTALFENTGVLTIIPARDSFGEETAQVLTRLGVRFEQLDAAQVMRRFPQFYLEPMETAIFEPDSGALMARHALAELASELATQGVDYRIAPVLAPEPGSAPDSAPGPASGRGRQLDAVYTRAGERISAGRFVFACGPWLPRLFAELLGPLIRIDRAEVFFLGVPAGDARYLPAAMPTWIDNGGVGGAYGFPSLEGRGCKVAVDSIVQPLDIDAADRTVSAPYLNEMRAFVRHRLPGLAAAPIVETRVCQYEMMADENYLLDRHPQWDNVWIAGGGSGHGYKTAPRVGRYVANLVLNEVATEARFALAGRKAHVPHAS